MREINFLDDSATVILKKRFDGARTILKDAGQGLPEFRAKVCEIEPVYDSPRGHDRITNTWYGRAADVRLTEIILLMATYETATVQI